MKPYVIALAVGLLVGALYAAFHVRSPAPPVIALVGLLGILVGEQATTVLIHRLSPPAPPPVVRQEPDDVSN